MKNKCLTLILIAISYTTFGQIEKDLNIHNMLRGQIYASSSVEDSSALGGFGGSDNSPKKLTDSLRFEETGLFLKIDTSKSITIAGKYRGYNFYIVNKTDSIVTLDASDSRLYVVAEAYVNSKWQPIEYLPSSWCGNSYHRVFLKKNEYWEFQIPKFAGNLKTKIRYRLDLRNGHFIYSNEMNAKINKKQLTDKQGHKPTGIMDPYND